LKHLIIIGVGGFARECYWHAQDSIGYGKEWDIKGFLDGDVKLAPKEYEKLDNMLLGNIFTYEVQPEDVFICAIGDGDAREKVATQMMKQGAVFINLIHCTAIVQGCVIMGHGNIIGPQVIVGDHAVMGDFVVLNTRAGLGHDSVVGSYSSFMSGASLSGYAVAGRHTYWATNAVALPHSKIGDRVSVGVGSVVFRRVRTGKKVFGNPAVAYE